MIQTCPGCGSDFTGDFCLVCRGRQQDSVKTCPRCGRQYLTDSCRACAESKAPTAPPPPPPKPEAPPPGIRGLELLGELGRGGMGVVYRARQTKLDRVVALKILPADRAQAPGFSARFEREAKALAALSHPNIVSVFDSGVEGDTCYLVMEFVDGEDLRRVLSRGRLKPDEAVRIVTQVCEALDYAHRKGIVHRDIKPENILLDREGRVRIADFGLAKLAGPDTASMALTQSSAAVGTLRYMAPEQMDDAAKVDSRADLYSTGVVLYELLTGQHPVGRFDPPGTRFDAAVLRALEKDPAKRPQTAREFLDLLRRGPKKFPAVPVAAAAAALLFAIVVTLVVVLRSAEDPPPPSSSGEKKEKEKEEKKDPPPERRDPEETKTAEVRFLPELDFTAQEAPAGRSLATGGLLGKRNPLRTKGPGDVGILLQYLTIHLRKSDVRQDEVRHGLVVNWDGAALVAFEGPAAERLQGHFQWAEHIPNRWSDRKGERLVLVFSTRASDREVFADLVRRVQKKLGLEESAPDLAIENVAFDRMEVPVGLSHLEKYGGLTTPYKSDRSSDFPAFFRAFPFAARLHESEPRRVYAAAFCDSRRKAKMLLVVAEFPNAEQAAKAQPLVVADEAHVLRAARIVAVLWPLENNPERLRAFADILRKRMAPDPFERPPKPPAEVKPPAKTAEIDRLEFPEGPLGRDAKRSLRTTSIADLDRLVEETSKIARLAPHEIRDGFLTLWDDCGVLAVVGPSAERLASDLEAAAFPNRWLHRQDSLVVFAWGFAPENRAVHVALVALVQERLGLPRVPPPVRLETVALGNLPVPFYAIEMSRDVRLPLLARTETKVAAVLRALPCLEGVEAGDLAAAYGSGIAWQTKPFVWIAGLEFREAAKAESAEARLKQTTRKWIEVMRAERLVVVLAPAEDDVEFGDNSSYYPFELRRILRRRLGM